VAPALAAVELDAFVSRPRPAYAAVEAELVFAKPPAAEQDVKAGLVFAKPRPAERDAAVGGAVADVERVSAPSSESRFVRAEAQVRFR
jgi:hypothetical protein